MDIDVFVAAHRGEWGRLRTLARRGRGLTGAEADELVALYQRVATHLSMIRSAAPDPALVAELSTLLTHARGALTGAPAASWRELALFLARGFPAAVYRARLWWVPTAVVFLLASALISVWIAGDPTVQAAIAAPDEIREMTRPGGQFESYYSSAPAASFAAQVWTNNAWVAAGCLVFGALLGIPVVLILALNAANVGVAGGLMAASGRLDVFFGLISPHGILELTAVFVAAGAGLRLGWTVIDPGPRTRTVALAQEGRAAGGMALGLTGVLLVAGVIEAFVTPSPLPTWARVGIGIVAEGAFLTYVFVLGGRAARAGETGDVALRDAGDVAPVTG